MVLVALTAGLLRLASRSNANRKPRLQEDSSTRPSRGFHLVVLVSGVCLFTWPLIWVVAVFLSRDPSTTELFVVFISMALGASMMTGASRAGATGPDDPRVTGSMKGNRISEGRDVTVKEAPRE